MHSTLSLMHLLIPYLQSGLLASSGGKEMACLRGGHFQTQQLLIVVFTLPSLYVNALGKNGAKTAIKMIKKESCFTNTSVEQI